MTSPTTQYISECYLKEFGICTNSLSIYFFHFLKKKKKAICSPDITVPKTVQVIFIKK